MLVELPSAQLGSRRRLTCDDDFAAVDLAQTEDPFYELSLVPLRAIRPTSEDGKLA